MAFHGCPQATHRDELLPHLRAGEIEAQNGLVNGPGSPSDPGPLALTWEVLTNISTDEALNYLPGAILSILIC